MELKSLKKFIKKREKNKISNASWIGTELKKKRIEKDKTLKEATNGKMSISYLSKLENGKINVNEEYIYELLETMEINEDLGKYYKLYNEILIDIPKYYLEKDNNKINQIYKLIINVENFDFELIKMIIDCYNNEFSKIEFRINKLNNIKETMSEYELKIFFVFLQVYFIKINETHNALEMVKLINSLDIADSYLKIIFNMNILKITYLMRRESYYKIQYDKVKDLLIKFNLYDILKKVNEEYVLEMCKIGQNILADNYFKNAADKFNLNYIKYQFYSKKYDEIKSVFHENEYLKNDINMLIIYLRTLYMTNDLEKIKLELQVLDLNQYINPVDKIFLDFLYKITLDEHIDYIKNELIFLGVKMLSPDIIYEGSKVLLEYYFDNKKYKSFCLLVRENKKNMEMINQVYDKLIII